MSIRFEVKMTEKTLFDFLLYHTYSHFTGMIGALAGVAFLVIGGYKGMNGNPEGIMMYIGMGVILLTVTPISLKNTARTQMKTVKMFQNPLFYELSEEGLIVEQNGEQALNKWENFAKVVSTNKSLILYVTRVRAIILPKEAMGDDYMAVVEMISTHVPAKRVKIRHVR